nr:hypothetical protein [Tanacetum cinerariifolium]
MCGRILPEESDEVEKYVGGLPDVIQGSVMESKPKIMQDAIEFGNDLMDQKIHAFSKTKAENKRKLDNDNQAQQQPPKKQNVARTYSVLFLAWLLLSLVVVIKTPKTVGVLLLLTIREPSPAMNVGIKGTTKVISQKNTAKKIAQGVADALAEYQAYRSSRNGDDSYDPGSGQRIECATRGCTYSDFLKCQPLNFKGTEGVISLTQWFEKMESVFHISNCTTVGHDAAYGMPWKTLKKIMTDKILPEESDEVEKYVGGLPDVIQGTENKRKLDNDNQAQQQPPKKQNVARTYSVGSGEKKEYAGTLPLCNKCKFHHNGSCTETGGAEVREMVYALGGGETDQDIDNIDDDINA